MGVFDFIRDAGAKIGIGDSTAERAAAEAAEKAAEVAKSRDAARARLKAARERRDAKLEAAAKAKAEADRKARRAALVERRAEAIKSNELEQFVAGLGLHADDLEIRFDDGTAYVEGTVATQEDRERIILAVGNVDGVEKVDEDLDVVDPDEAGEGAKMYTVVKGDTLSKIAKEFYGDASKYPVIFEANRPMLKDPDLIYPGQVLRIPSA